MGALDLYTQDNTQKSGLPDPGMPADAGDALAASWHEGEYVASSMAHGNAQSAAFSDYLDEVKQASGTDISKDVYSRTDLIPAANEAVAKLKTANPNLSVPDLTADLLDQRALAKSKQTQAEYEAVSQREMGFGAKVGMFLGGAASAAKDPINTIAMAVAPEVELGILGTALGWGAIGATSQAGIEFANAPYREQVQPGYAASGEALTNIAETGIAGAVLGGAFKAAANTWTRVKTGQWPTSVRDAGNIIESEVNLQDSNPLPPGPDGEVAHRTAMQQGIEQLIAGKPINVENVITPSILQAYESRLAPVMEARAAAATAGEAGEAAEREAARLPHTMERLSEVQLGEFRDAAEAARQDQAGFAAAQPARQADLEATRATAAARASDLGTARTDLGRLQGEAAAARARADNFGPRIDEATQGRLDAIDADLKKPGLTAAQQTALEGERERITSTIEAGPTEAEHGRMAGSLENEAKGLEKAAAKAAKAVAKLEEKHEAANAALQKKETKTRLEASIMPARAQARVEGARVGLRKALNTLADQGYGLKLSREDAEAMATRVIEAPSKDAAQAEISKITEELVDRRLAVRRAEPQALPLGEQTVGAGERARAEYHTEEMRKRITALAREVGYEMPKDEAAALAARVAHAGSDEEALGHLDELLLRPRTVAEPLPGTLGAEGENRLSGLATEAARAPDRSAVADMTPESIQTLMASPKGDAALMSELDRQRMLSDKQIPMVTEDGTVVSRSLDEMMDEIKADQDAAAQLEECAAGGTIAEAA